jgi:transcriptional regulator with XRE-family HTH domain
MSQGRKALPLKERRAIRRRLLQHSDARELTRADLRDVLRCGDTTITQWLNRNDPSTPDVVSLVRLARREGVSLDWLLLGEGVRHRLAVPASDRLPDLLEAAVVAAVLDRAPGWEWLVPGGTELVVECGQMYSTLAEQVSAGAWEGTVEGRAVTAAAVAAARRELDAARREARAAHVRYHALTRLTQQ